jgi:hypothetical protein
MADVQVKAPHAGPDQELHAIQVVLGALKDLDKDARQRVLDYVFGRLGIRGDRGLAVLTPTVVGGGSPPPQQPSSAVTDIRTLTEQKKPRSAQEMAILVGYYLAELAPLSERKAEITSADITKYFKQAGFKLPKRAIKTLFDARKSGYLDGGSETGSYKLNPVGYNLVTHVLPPKK